MKVRHLFFGVVAVIGVYLVAQVSADQAVANYKATCELVSNPEQTVFWRECDTQMTRH